MTAPTNFRSLCAEMLEGWAKGADIAGPMLKARAALKTGYADDRSSVELLIDDIEDRIIADDDLSVAETVGALHLIAYRLCSGAMGAAEAEDEGP